MDFWPLDYHLEAAQRQFPQAKSMLACFEHWFGPYPWYEDGYKLVEVPQHGHGAPERRSPTATGFDNGYQRRDALAAPGSGMKWDFIIVHESAHEWFGNNITAKDLADMWVHESFANYAEGLYTECLLREGGRRRVHHRHPPGHPERPARSFPRYGVNAQGSGDMYPKGGNMLHTIRQIVDDDEKWRGILRGLNHDLLAPDGDRRAGRGLHQPRKPEWTSSKVFEQYLRTTKIPALEYRIAGDTLSYRWADVVPGFDMPVGVTLTPEGFSVIHPTRNVADGEDPGAAGGFQGGSELLRGGEAG